MTSTVLEIFYKIREDCKALEAEYTEASSNASAVGLLDGCGPAWDGIMCWLGAPPNTLVSAKCPQYFGFSSNNNATKACSENGRWFVHEQLNR